MKKISLTQGRFALVDEEDYDFLMQWKWSFNKGYASRRGDTGLLRGTKRKTIWMHRIILKTPVDMDTDHADGDKLNNQRANLRICSRAENARNSKYRNNRCGLKGVAKTGSRWWARIKVDGKNLYLGTFSTPEEAHRAYCDASIKLHGEYHRFS